MALISQFVLRRSTLPRRAGSSARADILWLLLILVTTTMFSWKITLSSQFSLLTASEGVNQRFPAAPADQSVLRHQRERREDSNLDRRIGLRPRRHRPQANRSGSYSLPDSTDFERDAFRKDAHFTGLPSIRLSVKFTGQQQSIDSIRLLAGQQGVRLNRHAHPLLGQTVIEDTLNSGAVCEYRFSSMGSCYFLHTWLPLLPSTQKNLSKT